MRWNLDSDTQNKKCALVFIGNDCFVGTGTIILKGVIIGEKSIIGDWSVLTNNIPANEILAGNLVSFVKTN